MLNIKSEHGCAHLRHIAGSPTGEIARHRKIFPTAQHFPARDYRQRSPGDLLRDGTIGILGYTCMRYGRKRHSELSSPGAVGLWHTVLELLKK